MKKWDPGSRSMPMSLSKIKTSTLEISMKQDPTQRLAMFQALLYL